MPYISDLNFICLRHTSICNLNCHYCKHWRNPPANQPQLMSTDVLYKVFELARETMMHKNNPCDESNGVEIMHLYLEPLLNWENIKTVLDNLPYDPRKYNIHQTLISNGLLVDEDVINYCLSKGIQLAISFDGAGQKRRTGNRNLDDHISSLIDAYPFCFGILPTLHREDIDNLASLMRDLVSLPVTSVNFSLNYNQQWNFEELKVLLEPFFNSLSDQEWNKISLPSKEGLPLPIFFPKRHIKKGIQIYPNGDIIGHGRDVKDAWGNILKGDVEYAPPKTIRYTNFSGECENCSLFDFCNPTKDTVDEVREEYPTSCVWRKTMHYFYLRRAHESTRV